MNRGTVHVRGNLATEDRLDWLRRHLDEQGHVEISAAAAELQVSEMTIRRDLQALEEMGMARRLRGGAVPSGPAPLADRRRRDGAAKRRIAQKLLALVPDTGAIALDASSTILRLAGLLDGARELTVVTNSIETFTALQRKPGIRPLLTGGSIDPRTSSLVGPMAARAAGEVLYDVFFTSAAGVDTEVGASEACIEEAEVKRAFAAAARRVVLAAAASKLDTQGSARGISWEQVANFATELDPADGRLERYRALATVL
jgi:DeoR family fructose operon transcriptional repressor